jgi:hypothetical protein
MGGEHEKRFILESHGNFITHLALPVVMVKPDNHIFRWALKNQQINWKDLLQFQGWVGDKRKMNKDELTCFCPTCNRIRRIISLEKDSQGVAVKMSCGHSIFDDTFFAEVKCSAFYQDNHFNTLGKKHSRYREKISGHTKRPTRELMTWNWENRTYRHVVWEKDEHNNDVVVYDKSEPFRTKKKK